jgi:hypothetical protein
MSLMRDHARRWLWLRLDIIGRRFCSYALDFARLLSRGGLVTVEPVHRRFSSHLLGAVEHFLTDAWRRAHSAKRGDRLGR